MNNFFDESRELGFAFGCDFCFLKDELFQLIVMTCLIVVNDFLHLIIIFPQLKRILKGFKIFLFFQPDHLIFGCTRWVISLQFFDDLVVFFCCLWKCCLFQFFCHWYLQVKWEKSKWTHVILEKGSDFGSNFHCFLLGEIKFQFTKKKVCLKLWMIFQGGHKFQILKSSFVFEKERVFELVKLFAMFLTKIIDRFIFINFKVYHNQWLKLSQEFTQFGVA